MRKDTAIGPLCKCASCMAMVADWSEEDRDRWSGSRPLEDWEIDALNEVNDEDKPWAKEENEPNTGLVSEPSQ